MAGRDFSVSWKGGYNSIQQPGAPVGDSEDTPLIKSPVYFRLPRTDQSASAGKKDAPKTRRTLGGFAGVFAPVALAQFSTALFLRVGFVVGQAGILETVMMMILAYTILALTVLSICAISTNGAVEGGGAYYMISRALGPEFGGSIGLLFFLANVLSCALYITGFVEGITQNFGTGGYYIDGDGGLPMDRWWNYLYASATLFICLVICMLGGSLYAKTSSAILGIVVVCMLSVIISIFAKDKVIEVSIPKDNSYINNSVKFNYTGLKGSSFKDNLYANFTVDYTTDKIMNFATVFAIMFSSITGILNGANMSGELKEPSKSIPRGTLAAMTFTFTTYVILAILIGGSSERLLLVNNYIFLQEVNLWPPFVLVGIFAATLSAALGNLIGASRILEALAMDDLFGPILRPATILSKGGNPYVAVFISWFLVELVFLIGSLNAIAPITAVFFLLSYASCNIACMALTLASAPNFRPTFKFFSWYTCLLAMIGCLVMCSLISPIYTSVAIVLMLLLIIMLHFRSLPTGWGSISQALIFHQVRKYLLMLDGRKSHVKYWRPHILLMVARPRQCVQLIDFVNDLKKGGLYVLGHVKLGTLDDYEDKDPVSDEMSTWMKLVDKLGIKAFVEIMMTPTVAEGLHHLARSAGIGGMKINTVALGFHDETPPSDALASWRFKEKRRFRAGTLSSQDVATHHISEKYFGMRDAEARILKAQDYVKLVTDSLKMQKNVLLCRHFHKLNKEAIFESTGVRYIDVWPVNVFRPETSGYFDNTCLFMLQLACILNRVSRWKSNTKLRVFIFMKPHQENSARVQEEKLRLYLEQLRIKAILKTVPWEEVEPEAVKTHFDHSVDYSESRMQEYKEVSDEYVTAMRELLLSHSRLSAVTFLYLPEPPRESRGHEQFLNQLTRLTDDCPPTVMVHGLHPVTSTTL